MISITHSWWGSLGIGIGIGGWKQSSSSSSLYIFLQPPNTSNPFNYPATLTYCSPNHSLPSNHNQPGYDPSDELFGLEVVGPDSRKLMTSGSAKPRSWFGPNGQYIRELPCPGCRGRGYTPCAVCGIERSRIDCSQCNGKGINTCNQCLGDCVIWEESIDEGPWEKARSMYSQNHAF